MAGARAKRGKGKDAPPPQDTPPTPSLELPGLAFDAPPPHDDELEAAKPNGRPPHVPTPGLRRSVQAMANYRIPEDEIAFAVGISKNTLLKYYSVEIRRGHMAAKIRVHQTAYSMAVSGDNTAMTIFWLKVNSGWSEKVRHQMLDDEGNPVSWIVMAPAPAATTREWQRQLPPLQH